jgi:hypothetical protein
LAFLPMSCSSNKATTILTLRIPIIAGILSVSNSMSARYPQVTMQSSLVVSRQVWENNLKVRLWVWQSGPPRLAPYQ